MPYVNIKLAGALSREQKEALARELTESLHRITGKPKESVLLFIEELPPENIARAGALLK